MNANDGGSVRIGGESERANAGADRSGGVSRRTFLAAAGAGGTAATLGLGVAPATTSAQDDADVAEWLSDAPNYEEIADHTGEDEVRVTVGAGDGYTYDPPAIRVDPGTTVVWEWSGEGGSHDVSAEDGDYESEMVGDPGHEFEHAFDDEGASLYSCTPHVGMGMKGAVLVGEDVNVASGDSGSTSGRGTIAGGVAASLAIIAGVTVGISRWASAGRDEARMRGGR